MAHALSIELSTNPGTDVQQAAGKRCDLAFLLEASSPERYFWKLWEEALREEKSSSTGLVYRAWASSVS